MSELVSAISLSDISFGVLLVLTYAFMAWSVWKGIVIPKPIWDQQNRSLERLQSLYDEERKINEERGRQLTVLVDASHKSASQDELIVKLLTVIRDKVGGDL